MKECITSSGETSKITRLGAFEDHALNLVNLQRGMHFVKCDEDRSFAMGNKKVVTLFSVSLPPVLQWLRRNCPI